LTRTPSAGIKGPVSTRDLCFDLQVRRSDLEAIDAEVAPCRLRILSHDFELGAYGYLIKPFEPNELLINVANALRRRDLEADNRAHRERLAQLVEARTAALRETLDRLRDSECDLRSSQEETVMRLARAAEARDNDTGQHIHRMQPLL
jgi:response regulator RpfG family c-di-GMP phosphodiesterase